jgi:RNA 2',3'-cyclic 3'-phosphodiesterase
MADPIYWIRAFIAISLPPAWIMQLAASQKTLQRRLPPEGLRWAKPEQIHLTLKFLGNVSSLQIQNLEAVLRPIGQETASFELRFDKAGCFPEHRTPRVIWIGLTGELDSLRHLQTQIERAVQGWGDVGEDHPFHPHLTLARVKQAGPRESQQIRERLADLVLGEFEAYRVRQIDLMRSDLAPAGPNYTRLASIPLRD